MRQATVVQNMRSGKFGGTIVLGSQYRDTIGETHWYIGILKGSGFRMRLVSRGELLGYIDDDEEEVKVVDVDLRSRTDSKMQVD